MKRLSCRVSSFNAAAIVELAAGQCRPNNAHQKSNDICMHHHTISSHKQMHPQQTFVGKLCMKGGTSPHGQITPLSQIQRKPPQIWSVFLELYLRLLPPLQSVEFCKVQEVSRQYGKNYRNILSLLVLVKFGRLERGVTTCASQDVPGRITSGLLT